MSYEDSSDATLTPTLVIDEEPELTTDVEWTQMANADVISKFLWKLSKGYKINTIFSLTCSAIGLLSFAFPYCVQEGGVFPCWAVFIFWYVCSVFMTHLLVDIILHTNSSSFHQIIYHILGKNFAVFYDVVFLLQLMAYLIIEEYFILKIYQSCLETLLHHTATNIHNIVVLLVSSLVLQLPLSFFKVLSEFRFVSNIVSCAVWLSFTWIILESLFTSKNREGGVNMYNVSENCFYVYAIFMTCMNNFSLLFPYLKQWNMSTKRRSITVINSVLLFDFVIFLFLMLGGYFSNWSNKAHLVLFYNDNVLTMLLQVWFGLLIQWLIPYQITAIKDTVKLIVNPVPTREMTKQCKNSSVNDAAGLFVILLFGCTFTYFVENVFTVACVFGGVCCSWVSFYFPTCWYKNIYSEGGLKLYIGYFLTVIIGFTGCLVTVMGVWNIFKSTDATGI